MAWTPPTTFPPGPLSSATMNAQVRDNLKFLGDDSGVVTVTAANAAAAGFIVAAGWSITGNIQYRTLGPWRHVLFLGLTYTGSTITPGSDGDITNSTILAAPAVFAADMNAAVLLTGSVGRMASFIMTTNNNLVLTTVSNTATITSGTVFSCAGTYLS